MAAERAPVAGVATGLTLTEVVQFLENPTARKIATTPPVKPKAGEIYRP